MLELSLDGDEVAVVVHNRDGSIAEISGNGTRIAAAYAAERLGRRELRVRTGAGTGTAPALDDGRIAVRLGQASLDGAAGGSRRAGSGRRLPLRLGRQSRTAC